MTMPSRLWSRWKRIAHRAAEIQSFVILTILYWLVVVPIGLVRRIGKSHEQPPPHWITRDVPESIGVEDARRQY